MNLKELIERVKAATGPDRELDGAIEVQARRFDAYRAGLDDSTRAQWKHNGPTVYDGNTGYDAAKVTASIDAALALVERCLPGKRMDITQSFDGTWWDTTIYERGMDAKIIGETDRGMPTPSLAIILALLTALDQKEENK